MLHDTRKAGQTGWGSVKERAEHAIELAKARMGPLKDQAEHAVHNAKVGLESAKRSAEHVFDFDGEKTIDATKTAEHEQSATSAEPKQEVAGDGKSLDTAGALSTLSTVIKALGVAATIVKAVKTVQGRDPERGIPWLQPRGRGLTASTIAIFGVGVLAGAAGAVLVAPAKGSRVRASLASTLETTSRQINQLLDLFTQATAPDQGLGARDAQKA